MGRVQLRLSFISGACLLGVEVKEHTSLVWSWSKESPYVDSFVVKGLPAVASSHWPWLLQPADIDLLQLELRLSTATGPHELFKHQEAPATIIFPLLDPFAPTPDIDLLQPKSYFAVSNSSHELAKSLCSCCTAPPRMIHPEDRQCEYTAMI
jgi:hypothetical protein